MESFEMWCWRRMEKISWTDHVRNEEVLPGINEQRNILHEISKRKANWIGHILRRNCLLQRVIEGKIKEGIEVTGRRRRRRRKLLDDLKERRRYSIIYNNPTRCNSGSIVFIKNYKYALHVSDTLCVHLQEHYKLACRYTA